MAYIFKVSDVTVADILVCSFILELPFCKHLCIWITGICWVYIVCFSILIPFAPVEWFATCLHSLVGCEHIHFQCCICIRQLEAWKGTCLSCILQVEFGSWMIIVHEVHLST